MRLRWRVATTIAASLLVSSVAGAQSFHLLEATIDDVRLSLWEPQQAATPNFRPIAEIETDASTRR